LILKETKQKHKQKIKGNQTINDYPNEERNYIIIAIYNYRNLLIKGNDDNGMITLILKELLAALILIIMKNIFSLIKLHSLKLLNKL
jgi:hypothetical protein